MLFVVKILPELRIGKSSIDRLTIADNNKKISILFSLKYFKFLITKNTNKNAINIVMKDPTIPVSVNSSK